MPEKMYLWVLPSSASPLSHWMFIDRQIIRPDISGTNNTRVFGENRKPFGLPSGIAFSQTSSCQSQFQPIFLSFFFPLRSNHFLLNAAFGLTWRGAVVQTTAGCSTMYEMNRDHMEKPRPRGIGKGHFRPPQLWIGLSDCPLLLFASFYNPFGVFLTPGKHLKPGICRILTIKSKPTSELARAHRIVCRVVNRTNTHN